MKKQIFVIVSLFLISTLRIPPTAMNPETPVGATDIPLIYGTIGLVVDLDPHYAWDDASNDHINQVVEGLFTYNLGSVDVEIIPRLATSCGIWSENETVFTVPLRENVTFHDGMPFNASAVKWNFDRLKTFVEEDRTQFAELYKPLYSLYPDTPLLINETIIVNEFTVKFVLNYPYMPFLPLMCFTGSAIMSPYSTHVDSFLNVSTDILVGTGPYVHVSTDTTKTVFEAYTDYYRGIPAVQHMEWVKYDNMTSTSNALLDGEIDFGDVSIDFLEEFEASPSITVGEPNPRNGEPMKSSIIHYLAMNNNLMNKTIRQAISYAVDYDYIIEDMQEGNADRMISPIPEEINYHNPNVQPATYNVTHARQIIIEAGLSKGLTADSTDQQWGDLAETDPIATYEYLYNHGNVFREEVGGLVSENCEAIGITITLTGIALGDSIPFAHYGNISDSAMFLNRWRADYNDPSNYINPLFSNISVFNSAQVNDPWLQNTMVKAAGEKDVVIRKALCFEIQEYIVEDLMPWLFLYVPINKDALATTITNWSYNPMDQKDFFSITFHGEDAIIDDPQMDIYCGYAAPWDYPDPPTFNETTTTDPPGIPGYSLVALMSITVLTIMAVLYKRQKWHR
ncbi:MAG: ABC transporter substrate-binding protein [Promethearchaeota archaeon]